MRKKKNQIDISDLMVVREATDEQLELDDDEDDFKTHVSLLNKDDNDFKDVTLAYSVDTYT